MKKDFVVPQDVFATPKSIDEMVNALLYAYVVLVEQRKDYKTQAQLKKAMSSVGWRVEYALKTVLAEDKKQRREFVKLQKFLETALADNPE